MTDVSKSRSELEQMVQAALTARQDATDAAVRFRDDGFPKAASTILKALTLLDTAVVKLDKAVSERGWISVKDRMPPCPRNVSALGTPVLIWPKKYGDQIGTDGFAYYGKRATGSPAFYLHGAELHGVTHWQPMPDAPAERSD